MQGFLDRTIRCRKKEMFIYSQLIRHNLHNVRRDNTNKLTRSYIQKKIIFKNVVI